MIAVWSVSMMSGPGAWSAVAGGKGKGRLRLLPGPALVRRGPRWSHTGLTCSACDQPPLVTCGRRLLEGGCGRLWCAIHAPEERCLCGRRWNG